MGDIVDYLRTAEERSEILLLDRPFKRLLVGIEVLRAGLHGRGAVSLLWLLTGITPTGRSGGSRRTAILALLLTLEMGYQSDE